MEVGRAGDGSGHYGVALSGRSEMRMELTMVSPTRSANRTLSWPSVTFTVYCRLTAVYAPGLQRQVERGIASWPSR